MEDLAVLGDLDGSSAAAAKPDHVYMDAMGFGMGLCCLQLTFQVQDWKKLKIIKRAEELEPDGQV